MLPLLDPPRRIIASSGARTPRSAREGADPIAEALVGQLSEFGRQRFGLDWEGVVQQVDRAAGDDPARRFGSFLEVLLAELPRLVVYLDNLESLLVGPDDPPTPTRRPSAPGVRRPWRPSGRSSRQLRRGHRHALRRRELPLHNDDFGDTLIPVNLLPDDAVFRLMGWFPALRRLSVRVAARTGRPAGRPPAGGRVRQRPGPGRAERYRPPHGEWRLPDRPTPEDVAREWKQLVEPALPQVEQKLRDDLLFDAIWDHVLDDRGPPDALPHDAAPPALGVGPDAGAGRAGRAGPRPPRRRPSGSASTSLLEQVDLLVQGATAAPPWSPISRCTRRRRSSSASASATMPRSGWRRTAAWGCTWRPRPAASPYIETDIEAGHHLFQAGEYDRAYELLGAASDWLQDHGRVREGLGLLEPFLAEAVRRAMTPELVGRLLGTVGLAYADLGQAERAIGFYEQRWHRPRDRRPSRRGRTPSATWASPTPTWARRSGPSTSTSRLVIAREIGDRRGEGSALGNLGLAYADLGQAERAIGFYEQAAGHRCARSATAGARGTPWATWASPTPTWARWSGPSASTSSSLVIAREIGDRRGEGNALGNLGIAYADLGQAERAIGFYEQHLAIAREIGDRRGEGNALGNLGIAYAGLGQAERAIGFYEQQLAIAREIGDRRGEGNALGNLGLAYAALGQVERAIGLLEQALQIGQEIKDPQIIRIGIPEPGTMAWRFRVGMIRHADLGRTCWGSSGDTIPNSEGIRIGDRQCSLDRGQ